MLTNLFDICFIYESYVYVSHFSDTAPILWSRLPVDIINASSLKKLKSVLKKKHLFSIAFTDT